MDISICKTAKSPSDNLHNNPIHSSSHSLSKTMEDMHNAATANTTLKPLDLSQGKGIGYIPTVVDNKACANLDRI